MSFDLELRDACAEAWEAQLTHPFVVGIGDGSLPRERFQHYVAQDYVFLIDYGRLLALGAARAPDLPTMRRFAELTRRSSSPRWICTARSLMPGASTSPPLRPRVLLPRRAPTSTRCCAPPPSATSPSSSPRCCRACGRTPRSARSSPLPCARGAADPGPYGAWVDTYADPEFSALADWCRGLAAELGAAAPPATRARMHEAFATAVAHEVAF